MKNEAEPGRRSERHKARILKLYTISPWLIADSALWALMTFAAIAVRFDFELNAIQQALDNSRFYVVAMGLVVLSAGLGWLAGLYRGRYIPGSLLEISILAAVFAVATFLVFAANSAALGANTLPRSTPIIAGSFTTLAGLFLRTLVRRKEIFGAGTVKSAEPTIIFGAGDGGIRLVKQLRSSEVTDYKPRAILDDDVSKHRMLLDGVRVYGGREELEDVAEKVGASTLIIAVPSLPGEDVIKIRDRAEAIGLRVLVLPPINNLMRGRDAANELREVNVDDLLGRKPARLNQTQIAGYIRGKRILVTGAGGSIGSEICRQVARFRPAELMMLDRDESGLHSVQLSMSDQAMLDGDDTILASIRDFATIEDVFLDRRPEIVFHAAALKHMPLLETYPLEALKTNVLGTFNLLEAAKASGVETFVNISTDKAANPCSALGLSKRIAERITASAAQADGQGKYVSVRFGNVLGSRGSVLTVFEKQISDGGPVTVTDPEVERFFMTIPEACQLVLQASVVGHSGETLVLDMGEPVKIAEVAKTLIEQSDKQIEIVFTGLRQNEKISEHLFDDTENLSREERHSSISAVRVPPLAVDRELLEYITDHDASRLWLEKFSYSGGAKQHGIANH